MQVAFDRGEEMRTEISTKFAREGLAGIYAEAGLELVDWWTDPDGLFALSRRSRLTGPGGWPPALIAAPAPRSARPACRAS